MSTLAIKMVSLFAASIAIPSDDIAADKITSFGSDWKSVTSPLHTEVPGCRHLQINTTINWLPTKLKSPLFSGGPGNKLYPTINDKNVESNTQQMKELVASTTKNFGMIVIIQQYAAWSFLYAYDGYCIEKRRQ